jgi:hypothetical protein
VTGRDPFEACTESVDRSQVHALASLLQPETYDACARGDEEYA